MEDQSIVAPLPAISVFKQTQRSSSEFNDLHNCTKWIADSSELKRTNGLLSSALLEPCLSSSSCPDPLFTRRVSKLSSIRVLDFHEFSLPISVRVSCFLHSSFKSALCNSLIHHNIHMTREEEINAVLYVIVSILS
jgi:hypothetical protein